MNKRLLEQTNREYSPGQRMVFLSFLGVIFIGALPYALVKFGVALDRWLGLPRLVYSPVNQVLGIAAILAGLLLGIWSNYAQFTRGRGTPVPLMATQELVIQPPYQYCRNPMALGTFIAYTGVAVLFGSPGAGLLVLLGIAALVTYIKRIEEKEMETRFGEAYLNYKQETPFLFPRFRR
jgi:protein-S-isoprenylcysteine O-methyltransferase Ste14